jgi:hypothetical protein
MLIRSLLTLTLLSLCACGGDDEEATVDMSHCGATTCDSSQVFNSKTCQCDNLDMSSTDR